MNYIFDFDGTLMDTAPVILVTMRHTIETLGLPRISDARCRESIGLRLVDVPAFLFPGIEISGDEYATLYRSLFPLHNQPGVAKPFPGVIDTLVRLHSQGSGMAIASSRGHGSLMEFADGMGITSMFCMLVGAEDVSEGKPKPEPVLKILEATGWQASDTLVIGDADVDIFMGRAAGCHTCAVTYGNGSIESLNVAKPDYIIDSFTQLLDINK